MRTILFIISFILCNTLAIAQKSKYFDVKVTPLRISKEIELSLKNTSELKPKGTGRCNNYSYLKGREAFDDLITSILKEAFKGMSKEEAVILRQIKFSFMFDTSMKIVYIRFTFYEEVADKVMKWEKSMYKLAKKFIHMDIRPYFKVEDPELFQYTEWTTPLYNRFMSEKTTN